MDAEYIKRLITHGQGIFHPAFSEKIWDTWRIAACVWPLFSYDYQMKPSKLAE